jgi:hypothetical protein
MQKARRTRVRPDSSKTGQEPHLSSAPLRDSDGNDGSHARRRRYRSGVGFSIAGFASASYSKGVAASGRAEDKKHCRASSWS